MSVTTALAADLTWDNSASAGVQSTAGTWDNQTSSKWTSDAGATNVQWNNANLDNAIFTTTGSAYSVTLASVAANNVTISGGGAGRLTLTASTLTFGGTLNVESGNTVTIASLLSGAGSLVNNGNLTLSGTSNNFTGGVTLNAGSTLSLGGSSLGADVLGTGTLTLNGGALTLNLFSSEISLVNNVVFGGNFTIDNSNGSLSGTVNLGGATRTITSSGGVAANFNGVISNGGIIVAGTKGIQLSNINSTFAGGVTVSSGSMLTYSGTSYTGTAGDVTAGGLGTGTLTFGDGSAFTTSGTAKAGNNVVIKGDVSFNTNNMTFEGAVDLDGGTRTLTKTSANGVTFSGKISNGGLIIAGSAGTIELTSGESDFAGGVTLSAGASLTINNAATVPVGMAGTAGLNGQLGTGALTINGGNFVAGARVTGVWNSIVVDGDFTFSLNNAVTASGTVDIDSGDHAINVRSLYAGRTLTFSNEIKGSGDLTFTTSHNNTLPSTYTTAVAMTGTVSNTLTGLVTFSAGENAPGSLTLNKSGGATAIAGDLLVTSGTVKYSSNNNQIADTSAVTVNGASAVFDLAANRTDTVGTVTLDGGGSITGTGTSALTSTGTFEMKSGAVTAILAGSGIALNKTTAGTVTLSGANTFTGATTVDAGTLALGSTGSLASTSYSIADGATFNASAKTSYSLAAVATTIGVGATTSGFFNGPTGALALGNSLTLNFSTSLLADGQTYNLFDFGSKTGDFSSVSLTGSIVGSLLLTGTDTWTGLVGGYNFTLNQATGNLLVVSAVPEPSTYALLLGGMGLTAALIQRRRR